MAGWSGEKDDQTRAHEGSRSIFGHRYRLWNITNGASEPFTWVTVKKRLTVTAASNYHPVGPTSSNLVVTQHVDHAPFW
ncbi:hypothetical protein [Kibdelosporangium aridum]|uniref:hypothetical protein n=1 Tax=Kibdelosporangium aridum TaxID=2030 RepID=UPI000F7B740D|nr:hypothetical protein [Kibdelosporangium aridum]